jgi:lycopene cyclase domain-containing protein
MSSSAAYLFLELAIIVYAIGFGWEHWDVKRLLSPVYLYPAIGLAVLWFALDEIAVFLGLWSFPDGGTLPIRILSLPLEEYIIFFLHSLVCFILVNRYSSRAKT